MMCSKALLVVVFFAVSVQAKTSLLDTKCPSKDEHRTLSVTMDGVHLIKCSSHKINDDVLPLKSVQIHPPTIRFTEAKKGKDYMVLMADPDAPYPSDPEMRSWLHYLAINIKGDDLQKGFNVGNAGSIVKYNPPSPPKGGPHHYMLFAFEQTGPFDLDDIKLNHINLHVRGKFDVDSFVSQLKDHLKSNKPVAVDIFKTQS